MVFLVTGVQVVLICAYITLIESKVMFVVQRSVGPNFVGLCGLIQPVVDGVKLILKEFTLPFKFGTFIINLGPLVLYFKYS